MLLLEHFYESMKSKTSTGPYIQIFKKFFNWSIYHDSRLGMVASVWKGDENK